MLLEEGLILHATEVHHDEAPLLPGHKCKSQWKELIPRNVTEISRLRIRLLFTGSLSLVSSTGYATLHSISSWLLPQREKIHNCHKNAVILKTGTRFFSVRYRLS